MRIPDVFTRADAVACRHLNAAAKSLSVLPQTNEPCLHRFRALPTQLMQKSELLGHVLLLLKDGGVSQLFQKSPSSVAATAKLTHRQ